MSSFDILPTPKKEEKIRLWGQENFRRIKDAIAITNGAISRIDTDAIEDDIADLNARMDALERSTGGNREIGYAVKLSDQSIGTGTTDITSLSVNIVVGTRPIMVIGSVRFQKLTAVGSVTVQIFDTTAGVVVQSIPKTISVINGYGSTLIMVRLTPSAGARSYRLRAFTENNTATFGAATNSPSFIQVIELDILQPAVLDDFPIHFDTLNDLQAAFPTLDALQDYKV